MIPLAPALNVLRAVPLWAWALGAAVAWGGFHRWRAIDARADFQAAQQQAQLEHAAQLARDTAETQRRTKTIMEAADAATIQSQANRADAYRARAALERVRAQLAAHQADGRPADPPAAGSSAPAADAGMVPAELLGRCGTRILELARLADERGTAGAACERGYDALRPPER